MAHYFQIVIILVITISYAIQNYQLDRKLIFLRKLVFSRISFYFIVPRMSRNYFLSMQASSLTSFDIIVAGAKVSESNRASSPKLSP
jgi:hypothetical protein